MERGFISVRVEFADMLREEVQQLKGLLNVFGSQALSGEPGEPCGIQDYFGFFPVCLISGREVIVEKLPLMADLSKST